MAKPFFSDDSSGSLIKIKHGGKQMIVSKIPHILYGGDYNPEQWDPDVWIEDIRLMKEAGINIVSLGIFSWALLEPEEGHYDFSLIDRMMDLLSENEIFVDLATATAAQPAWLSRRYPDVLPEDEYGLKISYGSRQSYCPNSPSYRRAAVALCEQIASRYRKHPALAMWHINNEYACHISACYCDTCAAGFRLWLQERYGTLEELNRLWGTSFWSQYYSSWEEIIPPRRSSSFRNPAQLLDYARFMDASIGECMKAEAEILHRLTPDYEVTSNFMLHFKPLNYFEWAKELDIISWDSYPENETDPADVAFDHDLMRSLGKGRPYLLMEQSPGPINWRDVNPPKKPGQLEIESLQTLARGGDGVLFFQWRQSQRGAERFHAGCVPHIGEDSRIYREVKQIGKRLHALSDIRNSRINANAAIMFDYESWWALEGEAVPSQRISYRSELLRYYKAFYNQNIPVDFVSQSTDLLEYRFVVVPLLFLFHEENVKAIESFVANGGLLLVSYCSALVDINNAVFLGSYAAPLRKLLGIRIEELWPLCEGEVQRIHMDKTEYQVRLWSELIKSEGADSICYFCDGVLKSSPAITRNYYQKGSAWYLAGDLPQPGLNQLIRCLAEKQGIEPLAAGSTGVEVSLRKGYDGSSYLFILNHLALVASCTLPPGEWEEIESGEVSRTVISLGPRQGRIFRQG